MDFPSLTTPADFRSVSAWRWRRPEWERRWRSTRLERCSSFRITVSWKRRTSPCRNKSQYLRRTRCVRMEMSYLSIVYGVVFCIYWISNFFHKYVIITLWCNSTCNIKHILVVFAGLRSLLVECASLEMSCDFECVFCGCFYGSTNTSVVVILSQLIFNKAFLLWDCTRERFYSHHAWIFTDTQRLERLPSWTKNRFAQGEFRQ